MTFARSTDTHSSLRIIIYTRRILIILIIQNLRSLQSNSKRAAAGPRLARRDSSNQGRAADSVNDDDAASRAKTRAGSAQTDAQKSNARQNTMSAGCSAGAAAAVCGFRMPFARRLSLSRASEERRRHATIGKWSDGQCLVCITRHDCICHPELQKAWSSVRMARSSEKRLHVCHSCIAASRSRAASAWLRVSRAARGELGGISVERGTTGWLSGMV